MAVSQAPKARKRGARAHLKEVIREQGRTYVWLARVTGYSVRQITRVANGEFEGTTRFHIAMRQALGEDYAA